MTAGIAVELFRNAFMTAFWISLPLLMVGFVVGVVISLVQIVTSMQDASFSTIPRLAAFLLALLLLLPWMLTRIIYYTTTLFSDFSHYAR